MIGNIEEWCEDCQGDSYKNHPADGSFHYTSSCPVHVYRGGSWVAPALYCRSATRGGHTPDFRDGFVGFRGASTPRSYPEIK